MPTPTLFGPRTEEGPGPRRRAAPAATTNGPTSASCVAPHDCQALPLWPRKFEAPPAPTRLVWLAALSSHRRYSVLVVLSRSRCGGGDYSPLALFFARCARPRSESQGCSCRSKPGWAGSYLRWSSTSGGGLCLPLSVSVTLYVSGLSVPLLICHRLPCRRPRPMVPLRRPSSLPSSIRFM